MKNTVRIATLSALLAAAPAFAAAKPAKAPAKPAVPQTALSQAIHAFNTELTAALGGNTDLIVRLDKLRDFTLTAPTRAKVKAILGEAMPSGIDRQPNANGGFDYRFSMKPGSYTAPEGGGLRWSELVIDENVDKELNNVNVKMRWNEVNVSGKTVKATISDMRVDGKQQRAEPGSEIWVGNADAGAASAVIEDSSMPGFALRMDDIYAKAVSTARGKLTDFAYESGIRRISVMDTQLDDFRFNFHLLGLDVARLAKLTAAMKQAKPEASAQQQLDALLPILRGFAQSASQNGSALEIDDFGLAFQGNRVTLKGRLTLAAATEQELSTMAGFGKKIDASLTVTVPTALIVDVAKIFARKQMSANPQAVVNDAAVNQMAESMRDMVIGKVMGSGYGKLENDALVIPVEVHNGVITLNGKTVELPKQPAQAPAAKAKAKVKTETKAEAKK